MSTYFNEAQQKKYTLNRDIITRDTGFSLVEVVVVLSLLSILSTIAIPSFLDWLPHYRLKSATRDLYSNMQRAKIGAIKNNKDWALVFEPTNRRYLLCSDKGTDDVWSATGDNTIETIAQLADYQSGVGYGHDNVNSDISGDDFPTDDVSYNSNVAVFNSKGTGSSGYVYLENEKSSAYAVGSQSSGVIELKIWDGSSWE